MTKLSVIVHENDEVTVKDERGLPVLCSDCRFAGWLSKDEFNEYRRPITCLYTSGGSHPVLPVRIRVLKDLYEWQVNTWRNAFPFCTAKNHDGNCKDFIRAKPQSWWTRVFRRKKMRE